MVNKQEDSLRRVAFTVFNISTKNYVSDLKDKARKKQANKCINKRSKSAMKIMLRSKFALSS